MRLYVTAPTNWTAELVAVLEIATRVDVLIVDSEDRRKFAEHAAKMMNAKCRIEVEKED